MVKARLLHTFSLCLAKQEAYLFLDNVSFLLFILILGVSPRIFCTKFEQV